MRRNRPGRHGTRSNASKHRRGKTSRLLHSRDGAHVRGVQGDTLSIAEGREDHKHQNRQPPFDPRRSNKRALGGGRVMSANENPAPRANAGSRANSDIERNRNNSFALDWEADTDGGLAGPAHHYAGGARARPCGPGEPWEGLPKPRKRLRTRAHPSCGTLCSKPWRLSNATPQRRAFASGTMTTPAPVITSSALPNASRRRSRRSASLRR